MRSVRRGAILRRAAAATLAVAAVLVLTVPSSWATFSDRVTSNGNLFAAGTLTRPSLTATPSISNVALSWTNPDSLSGGSASFVVQRAPGACSAPGSFVGITGSPFAITTTSTSETVYGAGSYCYAVQSKYGNWLSPFGTAPVANQATVTIASISSLKFDSEAPSPASCSAARVIEAGSVSGSVSISPNNTTVGWLDKTTGDGLTQLPAGSYTVTLQRLANSPTTSATGVTVNIGTCSGGTFTSKGTGTGTFGTTAETINVTVSVASATTLSSSTLLAVRLTNTGAAGSARTIVLQTAGGSTLSAPSSVNP